jgi:transcriptional regulator with XRE-family HTH domain
MSIPHNLKLIRRRLGLSQDGFAEKMSVTNSKINMYEQGRADPSTEFLLKLTYLTGLAIEDLLYKDLHQDALPENMNFDQLQEPAAGYRQKINLYDVRNMVEEIKHLRSRIEELEKLHRDKTQ